MPKNVSAADQHKSVGSLLVSSLQQNAAARELNPHADFLTLQQLLLSVPPELAPFAHSALTKAPTKNSIIAAIPNCPLSPVALADQATELATAPQTLLLLARQTNTGCSPNTPVVPLAELVKALDKRLQKNALTYWAATSTQLPDGLALISSVKGKKPSAAIHDLRYPRRETLLAQQLITQLESFSHCPDSPYTTLARLISDSGIPADAPELASALALPEFQSQIRLLRGRGSDAWITPASNFHATLGSDAILQALLHEHCSESAPEIRLSALAKLLSKEVQADFITTWRNRAASSNISHVCECSPTGTAAKPDLLLRDIRFPKPEKQIAQLLIHTLQQLRTSSGSAYPPTWLVLQQQAAPTAPRDLLHKASLSADFQSQVAIACSGAPDSPVFFLNDLADVAQSPAMLEFIVRRSTTEQNAALPAEKLASAGGLFVPLKPLLTSAAQRYIAGATLPQNIALAQINRKWLFLDLSKVRLSGAVDPPDTDEHQQTLSTEFAAAFSAAFELLSRTSHLPGYVSLADLRPALPQYNRQTFDLQLIILRRQGAFSLSLLEGRLALSPDEQAAVLTIDNRPYLLVHRRR